MLELEGGVLLIEITLALHALGRSLRNDFLSKQNESFFRHSCSGISHCQILFGTENRRVDSRQLLRVTRSLLSRRYLPFSLTIC